MSRIQGYSIGGLTRLHKAVKDHPGSTAREIGVILKADPEMLRKRLNELKTRGAVERRSEERLVRAVRSITRTVYVWYATMDTVPELPMEVEGTWTPQAWVHPIRRAALGLPVVQTERTRAVSKYGRAA